MGVLQRFERRIETLVNRPFARAFKSAVQPVEVASALARECNDRAAIVARGRTMVPNAFVVELGSRDHERLSPYAEPLGAELADMVREHAQEQDYTFLGPVEVTLEEVDDLETGMFRIRSATVAGGAPPAPAQPAPAPPAAQPPLQRPQQASSAPPVPAAVAPQPARSPEPARFLEVAGTSVALRGDRTVIGRGLDADVRIDDPGVSRRHAEVRVRGEQVVVTDLGSTNGIVLGGRRVDSAPLVDGTVFELGSTSIVFRSPGRGGSER